MTLDELILRARRDGASDLHLTAGAAPAVRILGQLMPWGEALDEAAVEAVLAPVLTPRLRAELDAGRDADFSYTTPDGGRQRVNVYRAAGRPAAAIRLLRGAVPTIEELGLPPVVRGLAAKPRGLVLVTGPTGSGKSTTLAAMIQHINTSRRAHVVTIEDPVEYVYAPGLCVIHQREVGQDTAGFATALRSALREDPDVILVGEMRDYETITAALTAAETGHLVFSTLHTIGAAHTVDRIVNACPPEAQQEVRAQLAGVLQAAITQELVPLADGSDRTAIQEILVGTDAALNLIREGKSHQLASVMQTGAALGMQTLNAALAKAVQSGRIAYAEALARASDAEELNSYLGR